MIHPTALVDPSASLDSTVEVGPYAVIGAQVEIGAGTRVGAHTVILGPTSIGRDNRIFQFVSLGEAPQDKKYAGEPTRLVIGDGNTIREFCTLNRGTAQDKAVTSIGHDNWIMAYVHIAHDCVVGDHCILANNTQLAGHVSIGDHAILGGLTGVHQFVRVGAHVITAVSSVVLQDIPPFVMAGGNTAKPYGINAEGLRRRGFPPEHIAGIKRAFKLLYRQGLSLKQAHEEIEKMIPACPELALLTQFLGTSSRGIIR